MTKSIAHQASGVRSGAPRRRQQGGGGTANTTAAHQRIHQQHQRLLLQPQPPTLAALRRFGSGTMRGSSLRSIGGGDGGGGSESFSPPTATTTTTTCHALVANRFFSPNTIAATTKTTTKTTAVAPNLGGGGGAQPPISSFGGHRTPFLTLVLLKLDELLVVYCQYMAHPSHDNACKACACLDSSVDTTLADGGSPKRRTPGSPLRGRGRVVVAPSSPTRSPLLQWISGAASSAASSIGSSSGASASSFSASALEGEWEEFQRPFLLLAGAEVMYADMGHLESCGSSSTANNTNDKNATKQPAVVGTKFNGDDEGNDEKSTPATSLCHLYQFLEGELLEIRRKLCVPFLPSIPTVVETLGLEGSKKDQNKYSAAAISLSNTILFLVDLCRCRSNLVEIQSSKLFGQDGSKAYDEAQTVVELILSSVLPAATTAAEGTSRVFAPIQLSLEQELKAWKQLLLAAWSLERCLFLESIVSLRKLQINLNEGKPKDTRLFQWMNETLRSFQSLLPIYFDRVNAFAGPLYNFKTQSTTPIQDKNWNQKVVSFLRKQEKLGGPDTAVTIVLDAVAADNINVERGYHVSASDIMSNPHQFLSRKNSRTLSELSSQGDQTGQRPFDTRVLWPAVYMRSTTTLELSLARDNSTSDRSLSRLVLRGSAPSFGTPAVPPVIDEPYPNILQYGPDPGMPAKSWPHDDWVSLTSVIAQLETTVAPLLGDRDVENKHNEVPTKLSIRMQDKPLAMSFQKDGAVTTLKTPRQQRAPHPRTYDAHTLSFAIPFMSGNNFFFSQGSDGSREKSSDSNERPSVYHVVSLSSFLSLAVILKPEESDLGKFLRRRARIPDDEIRSFLDQLAADLRVAGRFSSACLLDLKGTKNRKKAFPLLELSSASVRGPGEEIQILLKQIKKHFGMRPSSPSQDRKFDRGHSFGLMSARSGRNRAASIESDELNLTLAQSAAALFLGDQLAGLLHKT